MEITYIGHSGFLLEWETCYWLFDYYKGDIPAMASDKKIFVFASHKHQDHFNPLIFKLNEKYQDIEYVLSSDIDISNKRSDISDTPDILGKILSIKPSSKYELFDKDNNVITLEALKSTDCGVAFLLRYMGKTIYHAGDLNLWIWQEESKQYNNNMRAMFQKEMNCLKDIDIDVAFAPLDPRQEEYYYMGLESLLETAKIRYVFPMHFWDKPSIIQQFKSERLKLDTNTVLMDVSQEGEQWRLEL